MVYLEITCKGTEDEADYWMFETLDECVAFMQLESAVRYMVTDYPMFNDDRYDASTQRR